MFGENVSVSTDQVIKKIMNVRNDGHFSEFFFEIVLYELASSIPSHIPEGTIGMDTLHQTFESAGCLLLRLVNDDAKPDWSQLDDLGDYAMSVMTAPYLIGPLEMSNYILDEWRVPRLFTKSLAGVEESMIEVPLGEGTTRIPILYSVPRLQQQDHDHFEKIYSKISPEFQNYYAAAVHECRQKIWDHRGSGGRSVNYKSVQCVEKYTSQFNKALVQKWKSRSSESTKVNGSKNSIKEPLETVGLLGHTIGKEDDDDDAPNQLSKKSKLSAKAISAATATKGTDDVTMKSLNPGSSSQPSTPKKKDSPELKIKRVVAQSNLINTVLSQIQQSITNAMKHARLNGIKAHTSYTNKLKKNNYSPKRFSNDQIKKARLSFVQLEFFLDEFTRLVIRKAATAPFKHGVPRLYSPHALATLRKDAMDRVKSEWDPTLPLRPTLVRFLDKISELHIGLSTFSATTRLLRFHDEVPIEQKRNRPLLGGNLTSHTYVRELCNTTEIFYGSGIGINNYIVLDSRGKRVDLLSSTWSGTVERSGGNGDGDWASIHSGPRAVALDSIDYNTSSEDERGGDDDDDEDDDEWEVKRKMEEDKIISKLNEHQQLEIQEAERKAGEKAIRLSVLGKQDIESSSTYQRAHEACLQAEKKLQVVVNKRAKDEDNMSEILDGMRRCRNQMGTVDESKRDEYYDRLVDLMNKRVVVDTLIIEHEESEREWKTKLEEAKKRRDTHFRNELTSYVTDVKNIIAEELTVLKQQISQQYEKRNQEIIKQGLRRKEARELFKMKKQQIKKEEELKKLKELEDQRLRDEEDRRLQEEEEAKEVARRRKEEEEEERVRKEEQIKASQELLEAEEEYRRFNAMGLEQSRRQREEESKETIAELARKKFKDSVLGAIERGNLTNLTPKENQTISYDWKGINLFLASWTPTQAYFISMENKINQRYQTLLPSETINQKKSELLNRLQMHFNQEYPTQGLELKAFGSFITGIGSSASDLDICVYKNSTDSSELHMLPTVTEIGHFLTRIYMRDVQVIAGAKVPIVKFKDSHTGIECDLNVQNPLGIYNSQLIRAYLEIDERLGRFLMILKHFAKSHQINDASNGYLSSYAFTIMAIVFFQQSDPPILPRLQSPNVQPRPQGGRLPPLLRNSLKANLVERVLINQGGEDFDCTYDTRVHMYSSYGQANRKNVSQLLFEFFEFYSRKFDYRTMEVCAKNGCTQTRSGLKRDSTGFHLDEKRKIYVSLEEKAYFDELDRNGISSSNVPTPGSEESTSPTYSPSQFEMEFSPSPDYFICVKDPFMTARNVAGTCRDEKLIKVWKCFDHAYKHMGAGDIDKAFEPFE
ncbi:hypothetical protein BGZ76_000514 [Entomortierella beljakovae]|nr:hypothetical protein BGZ76_000514 [Entomortierella beljakovae]